MVTAPAMHPAKSSNTQAISKTDCISIHIGDTSAYFACAHFKDPQIQTSLATIVIGKNINEPDSSNIIATSH
jgi:hypothetical protein